jgi:alpha-N-acetylglucosamine transferase
MINEKIIKSDMRIIIADSSIIPVKSLDEIFQDYGTSLLGRVKLITMINDRKDEILH